MEEPQDEAKAVILRWLNEEYIKEPNYTFLAPEIHIKLAEKLKGHGYDTIEKTIGLVKIMEEDEQLRMKNEAYRINNKGRKDLETIYDDDWRVKQMNRGISKREIEKEEKDKQFNLDERRHQEVVKAARDGNKINRIGLAIALSLGAIGTIVAIFRP